MNRWFCGSSNVDVDECRAGLSRFCIPIPGHRVRDFGVIKRYADLEI